MYFVRNFTNSKLFNQLIVIVSLVVFVNVRALLTIKKITGLLQYLIKYQEAPLVFLTKAAW